MIEGKNTTEEMRLLFQRELNAWYPDHEINAILYYLFDSFMGWSRAKVQLNKGFKLTHEIELLFLDALSRLKKGEPIQYIIGHTEFCGLILNVQPGVLIPRPETEELAVLVTRDNQHLRDKQISLLDLGTGSGCLALALKKAFPAAQVTGIDKSPLALDVARQNAVQNGLNVTFCEGDILHPSTFLTTETYHIIVSNPPYIPMREKPAMKRHVVDWEPESSLFVPNESPLLFYEAISGLAVETLVGDGLLYVEIHEQFAEEIKALMLLQGFRSAQIIRDMFGKSRFVKASKLL